MLTMEVVGNGGGGRVERLLGGGKGERNGRQMDDQRWDIVLVLPYYLPPFLSYPFVVESAANRGIS